jgi:omega-hydroxy-beta-dihydromenaquinone-9 sulfotransferase
MGQKGEMGTLPAVEPPDIGGSLDGSGATGGTGVMEKRGSDPRPTEPGGPKLGGYKDRPWFLRFWEGITFYPWLRLLVRNRFRGTPSRIAMAIFLLALGVMNWLLAIIQLVLWGRKITRTKIDRHPIFILGHWRAGTTWLHELMVLDPRHTFPTTYACFAPNHYLLSRNVLPRLVSAFMPTLRPMDNMPAGWDRPQEDEFALCNMGMPSPYLTMVFPNEPPQYPEYLTLRGVPAAALARWKRALLWFLQCVTLVNPRRIVLKSPPHTCRIKTLLELFPDARFVHIVRDPLVVFASTVNLWKRLYRYQGLQRPHYRDLEEQVFQTFRRMYEAFEQDRPLIPPTRFSEVRYEDLLVDPIAEMRRIYGELELGEFEKVLPALEKYAQGRADYQRNRYEIAPETRSKVARRWGDFMRKYGYGERMKDEG